LPGWPLAKRVVEVIADRGEAAHPRYRYGSGCVVAGRTVLTAAHVVEDAVRVTVRDPNKVAREAALDPKFVGDVTGPGPDLALVEITDASINVPAMGLAAVDRDSLAADPVRGCHVVGYPAFAEQDGGRFRATADAVGDVPVLSRLARGLLSVQVSQRPRPLPPERTTLGQSEWSGMSGAPVVAAGLLLGVVSEHAPREGSSSITATPLTALEADPAHPHWGRGVPNPDAWWSRLGISGLHALRRLPPRGTEPAYWATVREIHGRTSQLLGRQQELAEFTAFATGAAGYRWLTGGPWTGKTALVAEGVTTALPPSVDTIAYFLSRREADADSNRFLAAVVPQLAYLLNEEPPDRDLDHFRSLWERVTNRAEATGRYLLLVVDGLDEDRRPGGIPSVASLLPTHVGTHAHVLVTSRLKPDVPVGHPLETISPVPLEPFPGAKHLAALARQEIDDLLHGEDQDLAAEVLGVFTAASGALAIDDLATLTADLSSVTPAWARQVDRIITDKAARSLQPVGDRYQFAHSSLLEQAQTAESLRTLRHPDYRRRIHRWADTWRAAGWPILQGEEGMTPRYLLDEYPATLADQPQRLGALLMDGRWVAAVKQHAGTDRLWADLVTALDLGIPDVELSASPAVESLNISPTYLYERVLRHIPDPEVRWLVRYACVVRRVTAEVIRYVLAGLLGMASRGDTRPEELSKEELPACSPEVWLVPANSGGTDVHDDTHAQELFDAFSQEVWLVSRDTDGSLTFRPDIRRVLLPIFRDQPAVKVIHSAAVAYYQTRTDITSRAEELYHRLYLRDSPESLDQRWQPGVEPYLATALDEELPVESQVYLASRLNISLPAEVLQKGNPSRRRTATRGSNGPGHAAMSSWTTYYMSF
jgi:hypothetical protein